jgi:hypothetical protein
MEAKPVDSGENLVILIPDGGGVFYGAGTGPQRLACTNAVQTDVEVADAGGRGEEAAEAILRQRLIPAWSASTRISVGRASSSTRLRRSFDRAI